MALDSALLLAFNGRRRELDLVGKIILGYGEIEFVMLDILGAVLKSRTHAVRTMYQVRSEISRLTIFEALAMPFFEDVGLHGQLKEGLDAASHCKNIRNQYAHCTWLGTCKNLTFANLEEPAKTKGPDPQMVAHPLSVRLLREQWEYFKYTDHALLWLNQEYRRLKGLQPEGPTIPKPRRLPPPKRNSHGEVRSRQLLIVAGKLRQLGPLPWFRW